MKKNYVTVNSNSKAVKPVTVGNYYPPVVNGTMTPDARWNSFGWKVVWDLVADDGRNAELYVRINNAIGRTIAEGSLTYNILFGVIRRNAVVDCRKTIAAVRKKAKHTITVFLMNCIQTFGMIAATEYRKEVTYHKVTRPIKGHLSVATVIDEPEVSEYTPREQARYTLPSNKSTTKTRRKEPAYKAKQWSRSGHYRTLPSGKRIYIKPVICKRRKGE